MKNITLLALFAFSLLGSLAAQPITEQQHLPFQKISTITPYDQSIQGNFLFMVDDDIQKVIFNPARAGEMDQGFISTNIIPSGNRDNFSLTGLTKSNWFFSFGGNFEKNESSGEETGRSVDDFGINYDDGFRTYSRYSSFQNEFENEERDLTADISVSKIVSNSGEKAYSIGVFAGYSFYSDLRLNRGNSVRTIDDYINRDSQSQSRTDQVVSEFNDDFRVENEIIVFGIEFSTFKNGTDSKHKFFIQKNDLVSNRRSINTTRDFNFFRDSQGSTNSTVLDVRNDSSFMGSDPLQFRYEGYINKPVNWISNNDYFFLSANVVHSKGDQDFFGLYLNRRTYSVDDSVVQVRTDGRGISTQPFYYPPKNNINDELKGGALSLGYVLSIEDEDLNFFTGLNPHLSFYQISNARLINDFLFDIDQKVLELGTRIPLYISYNIKEMFSVWGGGNLNATYEYRTVSEKERFLCSPLAVCVPPSTSLPSKRSTSSFRYSESLFMGFKLSHKSGLSLVNNFRSNLTNVNSWVTSIRYSF